MDTVRKDLKEKIERMEKIEKDKRKNENILLVITERDFFRQEAIRLNQLCKELIIRLEDTNREMKFLHSEVSNITKKWKESENANKQLVVELERNLIINKELENKFRNTINNNFNSNYTYNENFQLNNENNFNSYDDFDMNNIQFNNQKEKEKIIRIIDKLRYDLKKERTRYNKIIGEFNKILLDKNKLEKIFIDCVEETRKTILHRKLKDSVIIKNNISINSFKKKEVFPVINDVKFENFLSTDKKKLIEEFLLKDEVINFIKENLFKFNFDHDSKQTKNDSKMFGMSTMNNFNFSKIKKNNNFFSMNLTGSKTSNVII